MPLGGKESKDNLEEPENFKKLGEKSFQSPTKSFQRSDESALKALLKRKDYFWYICILKYEKSFRLLNLNG